MYKFILQLHQYVLTFYTPKIEYFKEQIISIYFLISKYLLEINTYKIIS